MKTPETDSQTLLYLICAMSSMAFLTAAYRWLWQVRGDSKSGISKGENAYSEFWNSIIAGQAYIFLFAILIFMCVSIYDFAMGNRSLSIVAECIVMFGAALFVWARAKPTKRSGAVVSFVANILLYGGMCIAGWGLSVAIGFALSMAGSHSGLFQNEANIQTLSLFTVGLLWNAPIITLYWMITKNQSDQTYAQRGIGGKKLYQYLWPVFFAYAILFVPLMIQQVTHSPEWKRMRLRKPVRVAWQLDDEIYKKIAIV